MSKKTTQDFEYVQHDSSKSRNRFPTKNFRGSMPVIRCQCGATILVVPDLNAMNKAIEVHLAQHRMINENSLSKSNSITDLRQILITQLLETAAEAKI
jgi:hypothetical protein